MPGLPVHLALLSKVPSIGLGEVSVVSAAIQRQLTRDFGPLWGVDATIAAFERPEDVPLSDDDEARGIQQSFSDAFAESRLPRYRPYGGITTALVQVYDLVAPLHARLAAVYLERLNRMAGELPANRDDKNGRPGDWFRACVMPRGAE